jgi:hypothetical protein
MIRSAGLHSDNWRLDGTGIGIPLFTSKDRNVAVGSFATEPFRASTATCPLCAVSDQNDGGRERSAVPSTLGTPVRH